jgi:hypothetical protein
MNYEEFVDEVPRSRASPIIREEAGLVTGAYSETLRKRLSDERPGRWESSSRSSTRR